VKEHDTPQQHVSNGYVPYPESLYCDLVRQAAQRALADMGLGTGVPGDHDTVVGGTITQQIITKPKNLPSFPTTLLVMDFVGSAVCHSGEASVEQPFKEFGKCNLLASRACILEKRVIDL